METPLSIHNCDIFSRYNKPINYPEWGVVEINSGKIILTVVCLSVLGTAFFSGELPRQTVFAAAINDPVHIGTKESPVSAQSVLLEQSGEAPEDDDTAPLAYIAPLTTATRVDKAGSGSVVYSEDFDSKQAKLNSEQEKLVLDYMSNYFTSLARLTPINHSLLFAADTQSQANAENDFQLITALCGIRKLQQTDLSLSGYTFTLTVTTVTEEDDGALNIRASEESSQSFRAYPGTSSRSYDVMHTFEIKQTTRGWRLLSHRQGGSLNRLVRGAGRWQPGSQQPAAPVSNVNMSGRVRELLQDAKNDVARRKTQGKAASPSYGMEYDREAAAAYAERFSGDRNDNWPSYDRYGGNCQNFTSQALYAGGIPMDHFAPAQWKWYGDTPNGSFSASGRAPAWSGVGEFLAYVQNNSGYGMVAHADAPYYSGEVGDIIHLGIDGDWRHTVIITDVMKDKNGDTVDYLVASNTANLRNFPASAYYYTQQMLIRIYGWNAA